MKSMNRVQLIGYIGGNFSVKTNKEGQPYVRIRMATDDYQMNLSGVMTKKTSWHTVWFWDAVAIEKYRNYLDNGSHILVEGMLNYRAYTDKTGKHNYVAEIKASCLIDLDR